MVEVDATKNKIELFFKDSKYFVPPYQRPYAWKDEHREELFNDILENDKGYFLGTIIIVPSDKGGTNSFDIIDGQQRVTTISILMVAIHKTLMDKKFAINIGNDMEKSQDNLTLKFCLGMQEESKYGFEPSNQNKDDYEYLLSRSNIFDSRKKEPKHFGNRRVSQAFNYFYNRLNELDSNADRKFDANAVFKLLSKLLKAQVVVLKSQNISDAFTLFESLNNRGLPLSPIDILKNKLMSSLEKKGEKILERNEDWKQITDNLGEKADQVRFLRHYYHVFNITNLDNGGHSRKVCTKSKVIENFSSWIEKDPITLLNSLVSSSKIYGPLISLQDDFDFELPDILIRNKLILKELSSIGIAPFYALLMFIFSQNGISKSVVTSILNHLKKWYLRRHITNYPGTNILDSLNVSLIDKLEGMPDTSTWPEALLNELTLGDFYAEDEVLLKSLKQMDVYNSSVDKSLLFLLENFERDDRENSIKFDSTQITIEHIYPQTPKKHEWPDFEDLDKDDLRIKHALGNLTLTGYNSQLSNRDFLSKKNHEYGFDTGNFKLNELIRVNDVWTPKLIEDRTELLSEKVVTILSLLRAE